MRIIRTIATSAVAIAMTATPALAEPAAPNPAAKLSIASGKSVRGATALKRKSGIEAGMIIGLVAAAAVVAAIIVVAGDDDSDSN